MRPPEGMTLAHWEQLQKFPERQRDHVLERAAMLHYDAFLSWPEADAQALEMERPQRAWSF